jgi:hypothetical protein
MNAAVAAGQKVNRWVSLETAGWGDNGLAVERVARSLNVSPSVVARLSKQRVKTIDADLRDRIRSGFVRFLERQVASLNHELEVEKAAHGDAHIQDLADQAAALAAKVEALRKGKSK